MNDKKFYEVKNEMYLKEVVKSLRKEISNLIKENEQLKEEIVNLNSIIKSLKSKDTNNEKKERLV